VSLAPKCPVRAGIRACLLGEGLGDQQLGRGADTPGLDQRALGLLTFGGECFVLRQLDGCLFAGASVRASHAL
jgi:hypothetical protein